MSILKRVIPLEDIPGMSDAISNCVHKTRDLVCKQCGLGSMGHGPESSWLGYPKHAFEGVPGDTTAADKLTSEAYRRRCKLELCGAYCVSTHKAEV